MTRLATALLTALVLLFAAAPAVALACEPGTGRDDSISTLDQEQDQAGAVASTATASTPHPCVVSARSSVAERHMQADGMPTQYTDPMGTCLGSGWASCGDFFGYYVGGTAAEAGKNLVGVVGGTAVNAYETAVGFGQMCMAGSPSAMPGGQCIDGMLGAVSQQAGAVWDACGLSTRWHDATAFTCPSRLALKKAKQYGANCADALAASGYEAGKGCIGDFIIGAGTGAAGRGAGLAGRAPGPHWSEGGSRVPGDWGDGLPNSKGEGRRWEDPTNAGNGIRIDQGNPNSPFASQQVDHVVVRVNGEVIGRDGQPINGSIKDNAEMAHIPLSEWMQWSTWSGR